MIIPDAIYDVNSGPELWSEFERYAVRALATNRPAHGEGAFEDFYSGPPEIRNRELASICSGRFGVASELD